MLAQTQYYDNYPEDSTVKKKREVTNKYINLGIAGYGLGIGNSKYYNGIRINAIDKKVNRVNGINFSLIYAEPLVMNGINISILTSSTEVSNGINLAGLINKTNKHNGILIAGLYGGTEQLNGLGIALYQFTNQMNGIFIGGGLGPSYASKVNKAMMNGVALSGIGNAMSIFNGASVGLFGNYNSVMNGLELSLIINENKKLRGLQIAPYNNDSLHIGISIGGLNIAKQLYGFQFGLINIAKNNPRLFRVLPIFNCQFRRPKQTDNMGIMVQKNPLTP
ncbi:MAG: hypothetical protein SGJ04_08475 [Bacteroidota bacterium]|nr:hypothetical protein [Bacteroidota bacterium]